MRSRRGSPPGAIQSHGNTAAAATAASEGRGLEDDANSLEQYAYDPQTSGVTAFLIDLDGTSARAHAASARSPRPRTVRTAPR